MGLLDGSINILFKKKENGGTIFFPYGRFCSGYVVNESDEKSIKNFLKKYYITSFLLAIVFMGIFRATFVFILIPIFIVWYFLGISKFLVGREKTNEKMTTREAFENYLASSNSNVNLFLMLVSLLATIGSAWVFPQEREEGLIGLILFGGGTIFFGLLFFNSLKRKKRT